MKPEPYLTGERVFLRRPRSGDIPAIIAFYQDNAEHFRATDPERPARFYTEDYWRTRLIELDQGFLGDRQLHLLLFLKARPDQVVGVVNLSNFVRGVFQACHLGYAIARDEQGKGLMHEALQLVIAHAFGELRMHRIMANYLPGNVRSAILLARLGFVAEGYARKYLRIAGQWQDHVLTALVNDAWQDAGEP